MTTFRFINLYGLAIVLLMSSANSISAEIDAYTRYAQQNRLIDRPWEIRYVLLVKDAEMMKIGADNARKAVRMAPPGKTVYRRYDALFSPSERHVLSRFSTMAVELIIFDRAGNVTSSKNVASGLVGKRTHLNELVLIEMGRFDEVPYNFAYWFEGLSENDSNFVPAVCAMSDFDRYRKGWHTDPDSLLGNFGCREWTAQLHNEGRPYIDVTSYEKGGAFIKEFIGWADFRDAPKPVIGKHEKTWWCLHECPDGEAPGVIPDIAAWTRRHGFPLPKRPRKQPEFPDADFIGH